MEKSQGSILITGATGFIGRRLTQRLLDDGFSVRCMVRRTTPAMPDGAEIVQGDLLDAGNIGTSLGRYRYRLLSCTFHVGWPGWF